MPNLMTGLRLVVGLAVGVLGLWPPGGLWGLAALCFVFGAVTDFLDGWLARRLDAHTDLGRLLDPLADKVLVVAGLLALLGGGLLDPVGRLAALVIVLREIIVPALRAHGAGHGIDLPVVPLARVKTTAQMIAVGVGLLHGAGLADGFGPATGGMLAVAAGLSLWTGAGYGLAFARARGRHLKGNEP